MRKLLNKIKINFKNKNKGMTLIELMVVIAIFLILTGITIFDYSSFRSIVSTENLVNDIALAVRKAQSYAIGVRGISSSNFDYGYGVSFVTRDPVNNKFVGSNKSFIIFTDRNSNGKYDIPTSGNCDNSNECKEILSINSVDKISGVYYKRNNGHGHGHGSGSGSGDNYSSEVGINNNGRFDIVFKRPNPDALFCYRPNTSADCQQNSMISPYVRIEVSNGDVKKNVIIWNTGQIGIE